MRLQIHTTWAKIGINNIKPVQSIRRPRGEQSIQQIKAEMIIDQELPKVLIDQRQCFSEAGLKSPQELSDEYAQLGRKLVLEGTARRAEEGDRLGRIEDPIPFRTLIADMAEENAWPVIDFNIDFIPKSRPKIEVTGYLKIDWRLGGAVTEYKPRKAITQYQPGKVEIYLRQRGQIQISVIDEKA
ncbi:MAG: DUF6470 family protein [Bacillota bacterium]|nr:DUF6470 family protein [Thermanaerosceptrum fracticalcis]